jgi:hypothetical protein
VRGQFVELGVGVLTVAAQQVEGGVGVDPVDHHHDPFGLLNDGPMPEGFGDGVFGCGSDSAQPDLGEIDQETGQPR